MNDGERVGRPREQQQRQTESAAGTEDATATEPDKGGPAGSAGGGGGRDAGTGSEAGSGADGDAGSSSSAPPPPSGRHAFLGGVVVLAVLGGALWVVYDRGWVSEYMANALLSDLAANGPSTVVDLNGPGDKWQLVHVNATLRRKCAQPQYIERLMEGIAPTEHIVEVQRMCLVILSELAHDRLNTTTTQHIASGPANSNTQARSTTDTRRRPSLCCAVRACVRVLASRSATTLDQLSAHRGLSRALLTSALQGVKDVSQMSFVLLKQLVASEGQRKEMMEAKALQAACRAVKSDKPEVGNHHHTSISTVSDWWQQCQGQT